MPDSMLNTLRKIVQQVTHAGDFVGSIQALVSDTKAAMHTDVCSIYLLNANEDSFVLAATDGLNPDQIGQARLGLDQGLVGLVANRAEPINVQAASAHPSYFYLADSGEEQYDAFLGVPIIHQRRVLGVLVVQQEQSRRFDEAEEAFLVTLAAQLAGEVAHAEALTLSELGHEWRPEEILGARTSSDLSDARFLGLGGAPGIAIGTAIVMHPVADLDAVPEREADNLTIELMLFDRALESVRSDISNISEEFSSSIPAQELALFDAYLHMLDDNALAGDIRKEIHNGLWAQGALKKVIREHVSRFEMMDDPYLRERGADVKDLGLRLLAYLQDIRDKKTRFPNRTILVGEEITPAMLTNIPAEQLSGIVSVRGSGNTNIRPLFFFRHPNPHPHVRGEKSDKEPHNHQKAAGPYNGYAGVSVYL